jgi:sialidase-1
LKVRIHCISYVLFILAVALCSAGDSVGVLVAGETKVRGLENPLRYAQFREQNVLVTKSGRIVVLAQGRDKSKWSDRSGQDLVVCHSDDDGVTWSDARLVVEHGNHSICPNAAVYDRDTGTIFVFYSLFLWDFNLFRKGPASVGEGPECRQYMLSSNDEGSSWTKPREISDTFRSLGSKGRVVVFGSGEGCQLRGGPHDGRLILPMGIQASWGNRALYSDDHGNTWTVGDPAPRANIPKIDVRLECKIAQIEGDRLILSARTNGRKMGEPVMPRAIAESRDGGTTWGEMRLEKGLPSVSCNGDVIAVNDPESDKRWLVHSQPAGPGRTHGVITCSTDGFTWTPTRVVEPGHFAYSSLVELKPGIIAVFYESREHRDIRMKRLLLADLLKRATP